MQYDTGIVSQIIRPKELQYFKGSVYIFIYLDQYRPMLFGYIVYDEKNLY